MKKYIEEMFQLKEWAVLGATTNTHKFGFKIFKKLVSCHFNVTPINPFYDSIDGIKCLPDLKEQGQIRVVNVVVSPEKALIALDDIKASGIDYVWFQPGSYDEEVIEKALGLGLKVVYGYCVLVELGELPMCGF